MPEISVIMPVYNTKEAYFREAIESILNQTFEDFELIIVDDCSDVYVGEVISSYKDERILYFRLDENQGAANARNFAIAKAKGKYLAFMDSDDISLPNRLEKQYNFLEQNPEIGCLGTGAEVFDSVNNEAQKMSLPTHTKHQDIEEFLVFNGCAFCQSSVMLKKEILDRNNISYKTEYVPAEDYAFWLDLVGCTKFEILEDALVKYRFYAENISNRQRELQLHQGAKAQLQTIYRYCNISSEHQNLWKHFMSGEPLDEKEVCTLEQELPHVIDALKQKGCSEENLFSVFKKKFKKLYYRTKTLKGQWYLCRSTLNCFFKLSGGWRLLCLITRGIF